MAGFSLKQLEVFAAVAELNSFTRAGERLYLTQSTVSAHIETLEQVLGVRLFVRKARRQISLTPEGRQIYPAVKQILSDCDAMQALVKGEDRARPLLLGASTVPAQYVLPGLLAGFLKKHPDSQCQLKRGDSVQIHEMLEADKIRIGFVGTMLEPRSLLYYPLVEDKLVLITENNVRFRELHKCGTLGRELLNEPFIAREEGSGTERSLLRYLQQSGFPEDTLKITMRMNDPESIKDMVAQGAGVSVLSELAVSREIVSGKLLAFEMEHESLRRTIYMVCRRNVNYNRLEQQFINFIKNADVGRPRKSTAAVSRALW